MPWAFRKASTTSSLATCAGQVGGFVGGGGSAGDAEVKQLGIDGALRLGAPLGLAEEPVGVVEGDARGAEEQDGGQAEHGHVDMQPAHELRERGWPACGGRGVDPRRMSSHWDGLAGALRRYSMEAALISTPPLSSSVNGLSPTVTSLRMFW